MSGKRVEAVANLSGSVDEVVCKFGLMLLKLGASALRPAVSPHKVATRQGITKLDGEVGWPNNDWACVGVMSKGGKLLQLWVKHRTTGQKITFVPGRG